MPNIDWKWYFGILIAILSILAAYFVPIWLDCRKLAVDFAYQQNIITTIQTEIYTTLENVAAAQSENGTATDWSNIAIAYFDAQAAEADIGIALQAYQMALREAIDRHGEQPFGQRFTQTDWETLLTTHGLPNQDTQLQEMGRRFVRYGMEGRAAEALILRYPSRESAESIIEELQRIRTKQIQIRNNSRPLAFQGIRDVDTELARRRSDVVRTGDLLRQTENDLNRLRSELVSANAEVDKILALATANNCCFI